MKKVLVSPTTDSKEKNIGQIIHTNYKKIGKKK
jgi:hypothetical protein